MGIIFNEKSREFHLFNNNISYIIKILKNNQLGQLYFGRKIHQKENYDYLFEYAYRPMSAYMYEGEYEFSLEHIKQEYPSYGTTDFKYPAYEIIQNNGSRITNFEYIEHKIYGGKPKLKGLPATYTESDAEADTLEIKLYDKEIDVELVLNYTIFNNESAIARSCRFTNKGKESLELTNAIDKVDYELKEISNIEYFEFFDFLLEYNDEIIAVDAKFWRREPKENKLDNIENKLEFLGLSRAIIINSRPNEKHANNEPHLDKKNKNILLIDNIYEKKDEKFCLNKKILNKIRTFIEKGHLWSRPHKYYLILI